MLLFTTLLAFASAVAGHNLQLINNCNHAVPIFVDSWPGTVKFTGQDTFSLAAGATRNLNIPARWNGRVCHNADGAKCWGVDSMTEFNYDAGGLVYYDISNIRGYSIAQRIRGACQTVTCKQANCPCDQAYPKGSLTGCGAKIDAPVRACANQDLVVAFCPK